MFGDVTKSLAGTAETKSKTPTSNSVKPNDLSRIANVSLLKRFNEGLVDSTTMSSSLSSRKSSLLDTVIHMCKPQPGNSSYDEEKSKSYKLLINNLSTILHCNKSHIYTIISSIESVFKDVDFTSPHNIIELLTIYFADHNAVLCLLQNIFVTATTPDHKYHSSCVEYVKYFYDNELINVCIDNLELIFKTPIFSDIMEKYPEYMYMSETITQCLVVQQTHLLRLLSSFFLAVQINITFTPDDDISLAKSFIRLCNVLEHAKFGYDQPLSQYISSESLSQISNVANTAATVLIHFMRLDDICQLYSMYENHINIYGADVASDHPSLVTLCESFEYLLDKPLMQPDTLKHLDEVYFVNNWTSMPHHGILQFVWGVYLSLLQELRDIFYSISQVRGNTDVVLHNMYKNKQAMDNYARVIIDRLKTASTLDISKNLLQYVFTLNNANSLDTSDMFTSDQVSSTRIIQSDHLKYLHRLYTHNNHINSVFNLTIIHAIHAYLYSKCFLLTTNANTHIFSSDSIIPIISLLTLSNNNLSKFLIDHYLPSKPEIVFSDPRKHELDNDATRQILIENQKHLILDQDGNLSNVDPEDCIYKQVSISQSDINEGQLVNYSPILNNLLEYHTITSSEAPLNRLLTFLLAMLPNPVDTNVATYVTNENIIPNNPHQDAYDIVNALTDKRVIYNTTNKYATSVTLDPITASFAGVLDLKKNVLSHLYQHKTMMTGDHHENDEMDCNAFLFLNNFIEHQQLFTSEFPPLDVLCMSTISNNYCSLSTDWTTVSGVVIPAGSIGIAKIHPGTNDRYIQWAFTYSLWPILFLRFFSLLNKVSSHSTINSFSVDELSFLTLVTKLFSTFFSHNPTISIEKERIQVADDIITHISSHFQLNEESIFNLSENADAASLTKVVLQHDNQIHGVLIGLLCKFARIMINSTESNLNISIAPEFTGSFGSTNMMNVVYFANIHILSSLKYFAYYHPATFYSSFNKYFIIQSNVALSFASYPSSTMSVADMYVKLREIEVSFNGIGLSMFIVDLLHIFFEHTLQCDVTPFSHKTPKRNCSDSATERRSTSPSHSSPSSPSSSSTDLIISDDIDTNKNHMVTEVSEQSPLSLSHPRYLSETVGGYEAGCVTSLINVNLLILINSKSTMTREDVHLNSHILNVFSSILSTFPDTQTIANLQNIIMDAFFNSFQLTTIITRHFMFASTVLRKGRNNSLSEYCDRYCTFIQKLLVKFNNTAVASTKPQFINVLLEATLYDNDCNIDNNLSISQQHLYTLDLPHIDKKLIVNNMTLLHVLLSSAALNVSVEMKTNMFSLLTHLIAVLHNPVVTIGNSTNTILHHKDLQVNLRYAICNVLKYHQDLTVASNIRKIKNTILLQHAIIEFLYAGLFYNNPLILNILSGDSQKGDGTNQSVMHWLLHVLTNYLESMAKEFTLSETDYKVNETHATTTILVVQTLMVLSNMSNNSAYSDIANQILTNDGIVDQLVLYSTQHLHDIQLSQDSEDSYQYYPNSRQQALVTYNPDHFVNLKMDFAIGKQLGMTFSFYLLNALFISKSLQSKQKPTPHYIAKFSDNSWISLVLFQSLNSPSLPVLYAFTHHMTTLINTAMITNRNVIAANDSDSPIKISSSLFSLINELILLIPRFQITTSNENDYIRKIIASLSQLLYNIITFVTCPVQFQDPVSTPASTSEKLPPAVIFHEFTLSPSEADKIISTYSTVDSPLHKEAFKELLLDMKVSLFIQSMVLSMYEDQNNTLLPISTYFSQIMNTMVLLNLATSAANTLVLATQPTTSHISSISLYLASSLNTLKLNTSKPHLSLPSLSQSKKTHDIRDINLDDECVTPCLNTLLNTITYAVDAVTPSSPFPSQNNYSESIALLSECRRLSNVNSNDLMRYIIEKSVSPIDSTTQDIFHINIMLIQIMMRVYSASYKSSPTDSIPSIKHLISDATPFIALITCVPTFIQLSAVPCMASRVIPSLSYVYNNIHSIYIQANNLFKKNLSQIVSSVSSHLPLSTPIQIDNDTIEETMALQRMKSLIIAIESEIVIALPYYTCLFASPNTSAHPNLTFPQYTNPSNNRSATIAHLLAIFLLPYNHQYTTINAALPNVLDLSSGVSTSLSFALKPLPRSIHLDSVTRFFKQTVDQNPNVLKVTQVRQLYDMIFHTKMIMNEKKNVASGEQDKKKSSQLLKTPQVQRLRTQVTGANRTLTLFKPKN